jgi:predicted ribosomally synthesized peptide with nif11-like leader
VTGRRVSGMSWSELERLVEAAEADGALRRALSHCRSRHELVLAARRLGYRITRVDLARAWTSHQQEEACAHGPGLGPTGHSEVAGHPHG